MPTKQEIIDALNSGRDLATCLNMISDYADELGAWAKKELNGYASERSFKPAPRTSPGAPPSLESSPDSAIPSYRHNVPVMVRYGETPANYTCTATVHEGVRDMKGGILQGDSETAVQLHGQYPGKLFDAIRAEALRLISSRP